MINLNEIQCVKLDSILEAFGNSDSLNGEDVLSIEPMEKKANGLIDILKNRGFINRVDVEESDLPLIIFINPSAYIFMESGGFIAEYKKQQQIQQRSMSQVNIHSTGNGSIINTGNHNTIHATLKVSIGDINVLKEELTKNKVPADDIEEIVNIIKEEKPINNMLGPNSKSWIRKMLDKSMEGSWEIGLATAGGILTEILKKFYGL